MADMVHTKREKLPKPVRNGILYLSVVAVVMAVSFGMGAARRLLAPIRSPLLATPAAVSGDRGGRSAGLISEHPFAPPAAPQEEEPQTPQEAEPQPDPWKDTLDTVLALIEKQDSISRMLETEAKSGTYTFEEPFQILNPYGSSPLAALVIFDTKEPCQITVDVPGDTPLAEVRYTFEGFKTHHEIPVYGLYPDRNNLVKLQAVFENGESLSKVLEMKTEPLPMLHGIDKEVFITYLTDEQQYQPGVTFLNKTTKRMAIDVNGDVRWFSTEGYWFPSLFKYNGHHMLFSKEVDGKALFYEVDKLGKVYKIMYGPYGAHHDLEETGDGTFLITGQKSNGFEDLVYELDATTGDMLNVLDLDTVLQRQRDVDSEFLENDWFHNNAIVWDEGDIILSLRHQSAVVKLSWPDAEIKWIMADHTGWLSFYEQFLLNPIGPGFEWNYNQHAPELMPDQDNNPDTDDFLIFDNGNSRNFMDKELMRRIDNKEVVAPPLYSRMVQYRINQKNKTVQQIWQYGKERGSLLYSYWHGDADLLPNGNRLGHFHTEKEAIYCEVNPSGQLIWEAYNSVDANYLAVDGYRGDRMPLYDEGDDNLTLAAPVINLIPEDVLARE